MWPLESSLAIVDASGAASRVVLVSFQDAVVRGIRMRRPDLVTGMSLAEFVPFARLGPAAEGTYAPRRRSLSSPRTASPRRSSRAPSASACGSTRGP
jgi:hypothetical protein